MPKLAIDYSKSIIYKLVCADTRIIPCYVGSSTHFKNRKSTHKSSCCNPNNRAHNRHNYAFIRNHGGWENWNMIQVESYPCSTRLDLLQRERLPH